MLDFVRVSTRSTKRGVEVFPKFVVKKTKDLMIRGGAFYAIWDESAGLWSTDPYRAIDLIDAETKKVYDQFDDEKMIPLYLWDGSSKMVDDWNHYLTHQCTDNYIPLDESLTFANQEVRRENHISKRLNYPIEPGSHDSYDELMDVLYSPEERHKIEWIVGSVITGASKDLQKFLVLYGSAGTGKSTVLNIVQMLFDGYYSVFDAKALGSNGSQFAMECFKSNPLVAIQHDGDLSHIEDNTRLNSLVSHELMPVNEKFKSTYSLRFNTMLFMGTNRPVKITDAKSGIIRRLIDASPTGNKVSHQRYNVLMSQVKFELGAIASHCKEVFEDDPQYYDTYVPKAMIGASNTFYNFILDNYPIFSSEEGISLKESWKLYKSYCDDAQVPWKMSLMAFKEELKNYFDSFEERYRLSDGTQTWNYYIGFKKDKFVTRPAEEKKSEKTWLSMDSTESIFDTEYANCPAQYCNVDGNPTKKWADCLTSLIDIDSKKLHYVKPPENMVVIDIDLKDAEGNKSSRRSIEAARKFPKTYAEFSKSGEGIHLHYIYDGDVSKLSNLFDVGIEIKTFLGGAAIRRLLTRCNREPIAHINTGLPLKGDDSMVSFEGLKNEKALRTLIVRNLNKEIHPGTKPSIDFIYKILEDAYQQSKDNGKNAFHYDVSDMRPAVDRFANNSTNHADYCLQMVDKMHFKSDEPSENFETSKETPIVFYDVEVFPNLFVVCWKFQDGPVQKMINPKPAQLEFLFRYRLVGFNNRRYDNHMVYARSMAYTNEQLFNLSKRIIDAKKNNGANCFFGEAYNLSYTDIYDFSSIKQSLKKFEIQLGIHHQECPYPWDQPVPEDKWDEVADYCCNDVLATEAVWNDRAGDFLARQILADLAGMTVNDTTNSLTTRIIFGNDRNPQSKHRWRDLSKPVLRIDPEMESFLKEHTTVKLGFDEDSYLPWFPGYVYDKFTKTSTYCDEVVGEGGYVYAKPGMYGRCKVFDVASMHPHSATSEYLFGEYTERFNELMEARVAVKHGDFETAGKLFDGKLKKYLTDKTMSKALANALKIAINSVYGLTAASFDNPFRNPDNIDNIVAKRGALFMITLKNAVINRGYTVVHCKTDSIKVYNPDQEIEKFIMDFGRKYGYQFEVENVFERVCLVNDAVFIAKCDADDPETPGKWTATGAEFAVPFVFKTLFSHEPVEFEDLTRAVQVTSELYLDFNEGLPDDPYEVVYKETSGFGSSGTKKEKVQVWKDENHMLRFVGRTGLFCPVKPGTGGALLLRKNGDKFASATGCKGYRWREAEEIKERGLEKDIDMSYFRDMVDTVISDINKFGDARNFIESERYLPDFLAVNDDVDPGVPWDETR